MRVARRRRNLGATKGDLMSILWIAITFIFTLTVVGLAVFALFWALTGNRGDHVEEPMVDAGWRGWHAPS
jgi:hypothetical protein